MSEKATRVARYLAFQEAMARFGSVPCKYGHASCSDCHGGRCSDEEYAQLTEAEREEVDER